MALEDYASNTISADVTNFGDKLSSADTDVQKALDTLDDHTHGVLGTSTNNTTFATDGHQTMAGTAKPWRDELGDAVSLQQSGPGVSRDTANATVNYTTASNLSDFMYANVQLNHDKELSASIYPHIHWFQASAEAPNFLLQYRWQADGAIINPSWTSIKCNTCAHTFASGVLHQLSYSQPISAPTNSSLSDIVQFKIFRDNANTSELFDDSDLYTGTTQVIAFDVHFQINSLGSTDQFTKV